MIDEEIKKPSPKRPPAKKPETVIGARDIQALLSLLFSILAASLPDQKLLDFGKNPPEEISLRDLWTIPDDELALISEPAARMLSRASTETQKRIMRNWDLITLMIGIAGVIGLRGVRHYEIVSALAKQKTSAPIPPERPSQNGAAQGVGGAAYNVWQRGSDGGGGLGGDGAPSA